MGKRPQWKDEVRKGISESSEIQTELLRISIHRHIHNPGKWHVSCYTLNLDTHALQATELEQAKKEGLNLVRRKARRIYLEVRHAMGLPGEDEHINQALNEGDGSYEP